MADFVPFLGGEIKKILIGGEQVGAATLLRFYVLHVVLLPVLIIGAWMLHIWRWRKDAMIDVAREEANSD
jgi:quinol-cytochrome oxidoreductase complex cytochrome b subunit